MRWKASPASKAPARRPRAVWPTRCKRYRKRVKRNARGPLMPLFARCNKILMTPASPLWPSL